MEIRLEKRAVKQIRLSAADAIEEGDTETLREDIMEAFTDEQIEEIERRVDTADFYDFLSEILDEWAGDEVEELFELLEAQLSEASIDLKYHAVDLDDDDEDASAAAADDDDDDDDDDDEEEDYTVEDDDSDEP